MPDLTVCFSALSDATRLGIVEQLMAQGELPAGALIPGRDMSGAAISRHLKVLRKAGLIQQRVQGAQRLYSIQPDGLRAIADWTISKREFWDTSLDRLEAAIVEARE